MESKDLLIEAYSHITRIVHQAADGLAQEQLSYRPEEGLELDLVAGVAPDSNPGQPPEQRGPTRRGVADRGLGRSIWNG